MSIFYEAGIKVSKLEAARLGSQDNLETKGTSLASELSAGQ